MKKEKGILVQIVIGQSQKLDLIGKESKNKKNLYSKQEEQDLQGCNEDYH